MQPFTWVKEAGSTSSHDVHAETRDWMVVQMSMGEWLYSHNMVESVCRDIFVDVKEVFKGVVASRMS